LGEPPFFRKLPKK